MVQMIIELVRNRSFTLTTGDSKPSRLRRLKNGVSQGSVLAPLLFNIYIYDLPSITSKKYAYADDLAILHSLEGARKNWCGKDWKVLKRNLSDDMTTLSAYHQTWRLKLSHAKTVTVAFHLHNREPKREPKVKNNGKFLPFCSVPTYLGVKLDIALTYRHHLEALRKKLSTRVSLLRRLADSGWGAGAKTLRTAALSLIYSTAEYCAPAWCRNAHTRLIDSVLDDALRIVTGCLRPTRTDNLPVLSVIQPAELRRQGAKLLHNLSEMGIRDAQWTNLPWDTEYSESMLALGVYIPRVITRPIGMSLTRIAWVKLNRLRTDVGRFASSMHKWGLASSAKCECGASEQTADHIILTCPTHRGPQGIMDLTVLDDETRCWLNSITASI